MRENCAESSTVHVISCKHVQWAQVCPGVAYEEGRWATFPPPGVLPETQLAASEAQLVGTG